MTTELRFYFDRSACTGCKACVTACRTAHDLPEGLSFRRVEFVESGRWERPADGGPAVPVDVRAHAESRSCRHCRKPACLAACPRQAIAKLANGIVVVNADACTGCRLCIDACPHGAMSWDPVHNVAAKCDFCRDALARGAPPACVAACNMRALDFGPAAERRARYGRPNAGQAAPPSAQCPP
ncbi:MAG: 4Fe-4S dicluster domain-containing protein [Kiritimatiellae bacterium]|nr:4Fe-4S dicluster domain-containing protein [Kiritimatiellia bacterium]